MPAIAGMAIGFAGAFICGIRVTKALDRNNMRRVMAWVVGWMIFVGIEIFYFPPS